jgi:hypothetical protein
MECDVTVDTIKKPKKVKKTKKISNSIEVISPIVSKKKSTSKPEPISSKSIIKPTKSKSPTTNISQSIKIKYQSKFKQTRLSEIGQPHRTQFHSPNIYIELEQSLNNKNIKRKTIETIEIDTPLSLLLKNRLTCIIIGTLLFASWWTMGCNADVNQHSTIIM